MYDIIIIGGGIVGLATGVKILQSRPDLKIAILEKENELAKHQTANNSGVIHSGLYYKPGSLKATNCINGYQELIKFCREEDIPFEITGKVVVATRKDQLHILDILLERGLQNGLNGTRKITLEELKEYEPYCAGVGAIHVPQTGIVDYLKVALAYGKKIKNMGGEIFTGNKVLKIDQKDSLNHIETSKSSFKAKLVINCAGLYSDKVARLNDQSIDDVKIIPFRGEYYTPQKILEGYQGYLQSDGYAVYEDFGNEEGITLVGCLAHARRKFHEAMQSDKTRSEEALALFQSVYAVERHIREHQLVGEVKLQYRKDNAMPLLEELKAWMMKTYPTVLPKSAMGKAIEYNLKRWDKLCLYAQTDMLEPDNNRVENSIRPVAIGRKNYLFAGSHDAAQRGAMMYSLLGTCKAHGIEPYAWLKDILFRLPSHPINRIKELLPQYYNK